MARTGPSRKNALVIIVTSVLMVYAGFMLFWCPLAGAGEGGGHKASGELVRGFRVLPVQAPNGVLGFFVFRGDYIKFDIGAEQGIVLSIPALDIETPLTSDLNQAPYFKMKKTGVFDLFINDIAATLTVMEYEGAYYRPVSAEEAKDVIQTFFPLILDVRTPKEYIRGHLADALLIPVQDLQRRLSELSSRKDDPILIYCATGNRSTVASKILIDRGFTRIFNLRHGIVDWHRKKYPVVK